MSEINIVYIKMLQFLALRFVFGRKLDLDDI